MTKFISVCITILLLAGCAASNYRSGISKIEGGEYFEAIKLLVAAEKENPRDHRVRRELGVVLYKMRHLDEAVLKLREAKALQPNDSKTVFYLGLTYEAKGDLANAIDEYKNYRSLSRSGGFREKISKRIRQITLEKMAKEIQFAISNEQKLNPSAYPENTVAVLYFENLTDVPGLNPLQKGIAEMLTTDLAKVKKLQVVERLKLQKLLDELQLGESGMVDTETAPRVGRLIGARKLIKGGVTDLEGENIRIDASLTEIATSRLSPIDEITGKLARLFQMEKQLAFTIIDDMGIKLTTEEREAIQQIPTENLLAFLAYSKGLDFEDRGMFQQAKVEYQKAVQIDPKFQLAQTRLQEAEINELAAKESKTDAIQLEKEHESIAEEVQDNEQLSRLMRTGFAAQTGHAPQGNDSREPLPEGTGLDGLSSDNVLINVSVPLPDRP
jgi:TolB-like protein